MIELSLSLDQHIERTAILHPCICPRQIIGLRLARFACRWLGIDPVVQRKQIFVYMEMGRCAADSVILVTGASPTNQLMKLMGYGKLAATFVSLYTGAALRVSEHPDARQAAVDMLPHITSAYQAQLEAYRIMPDDLLLRWEEVSLIDPMPMIPDKNSVQCSECGDRINENAHRMIDGLPVCKPCADGAYYRELELMKVSRC